MPHPVSRRSVPLSRPARLAAVGLLSATALLAAGPGAASADVPPSAPSEVGEPAGQGVFRFPQALAVDPRTGNVFVGDQYSGRIQVFDGGGVPRFSFGGYAARGEAGRLGVVGGVSIDRQGRVYVLDSENDRVSIFSADDGRYLTSFGDASVFSLKPSTDREDSGIAVGGLTVSQTAAGRPVKVFVADSGGDRIVRFELDPGSLASVGGTTVTRGLNIKRPQGVGVDPRGRRLYVPDNQNHRVLVLDADSLRQVGRFGRFGADPGEFKFPYDLAVDDSSPNQLYVGDNINGRVNVFDAGTYELLATFGKAGYRVGRFSIVRAVATNPVDTAGGVWVADTANNRIQRLSRTGSVTGAWGVAGRGPGYVTRARGVAMRGDGAIAVADSFAHRAEIFAGDGTYIGMFGRINKVNGFAAPGHVTPNQLTAPGGVAFDTGGALWVADTFNNRLVRFDASGAVLAQTAKKELSRPRSVAPLPDGSVLATDSGGGRLVRVDPSGAVSTVRDGLTRPAAVTTGPTGKAFVGGTRLIIDHETGARVTPPDEQFWDGVHGLALAGDGTLYVAESRTGTPNGARVLRGVPKLGGGYSWNTVLSEGSGPNQVNDPANLALSPDGRTLLVADAGNSRVLRLDAPGSAPPARQTVSATVGGGPTQGTITSDPPGIDCGTDCSQLMGTGRTVRLTARASENARFLGWSGDCAPSGSAAVCEVRADRAIAATGTFGAIPAPPVKLRSATLSSSRLRLARKAVTKRGSRKARPAAAATRARLIIKLTQDARVRVQVEQARPGRTSGSSCRAVRSGARSTCTRFALLPTSRTLRLVAGRTTADVGPRFPGRTLAPGIYRLRVTAIDQDGHTDVRRSKRFRVIR